MPYSLLMELAEIPLDLRVKNMTILNKESLKELPQYAVFHVKMIFSIRTMYELT